MPIIDSNFTPYSLLLNPHLQTVIPSTFRRPPSREHIRERIETPDGDFIDLDLHLTGSPNVILMLHGLEGSSDSSYMLGMTTALTRQNFDVIAINLRGCSGEPNRLLPSYHSGKTDDLDLIVTAVVNAGRYEQISLLGFSIGGNIVLKYLGERGNSIGSKIRSAVAISVPCDLSASAAKLAAPKNRVYMHRFARLLRRKLELKSKIFPRAFGYKPWADLKTFFDFDSIYTAPVHGFSSAEQYWAEASSNRYLSTISIPTLLVTAQDDPFLSEACFPFEIAKKSEFLHLECTGRGGHVGFIDNRFEFWLEKRTTEWFAL